jgi:hypothetical protein
MSKRAYYGAAMWAARQEERSRSRPGRTPGERVRPYAEDTNDLLPELEDEDRGESATARRSWT